jgi:methyl-accepting chemotaxis protein
MFWTRSLARNADDDAVLAAAYQSQAIIFFEPDGTIVNANAAFVATMGYDDASEIIGKHHRIFLSEADRNSDAYKDFWPSLARGEISSGEFKRISKSGDEVWISASYAPVRDEHGRVRQVVKLASDVTASHRIMQLLVEGLAALREGDLTASISDPVAPQHQSVKSSFNETLAGLEELLNTIRSGSERLHDVGRAVQNGARQLQQKAQAQKDMLAETTSSLSQISQAVAGTSNSTRELDQEAALTADKSREGSRIVADTITAIKRIETLSKEVSKTTEVIEGFAFQTNLLSLNAAVEAARAGAARSGFAVVASEVRNLSNRSAEASKEIAKLTRSCETEVMKGRTLIETAGASLDAINHGAATVAEAVDRIARTATQQSQSVLDIESAIRAIDIGVQNVATLSDDSAAQVKRLSDELAILDNLLSRFQTRQALPQIPAQMNLRQAG